MSSSATQSESVVGLPVVILVLFVSAFASWILAVIPAAYRMPKSVVLFVFGAGLSYLAPWLGVLGKSIEWWQLVDPHTVLFIMLPPLLFQSAFTLDFHIFRKVAGGALLMAIPGVFISLILTALFLMCLKDWNWSSALLLGSVLSATDPVAVVAILHELQAPAKLSTLIEGESLLNDGSAFVLFLIFKKLLAEEYVGERETATALHNVTTPTPSARLLSSSGSSDVGGYLVFFMQLGLGGACFGILTASLMCQWLDIGKHTLDFMSKTSIVLCGVFATFYLAETSVHVSGVLATVAFGLHIAAGGKYTIGHGSDPEKHATIWTAAAHFSDALIFVLAGMVAWDKLYDFADQGRIGLCLLLYIVLHVIRALIMLVFWAIFPRLGTKLSVKEGVIVTYGGMRGAVGLALGLIVEQDKNIQEPVSRKILFYICGIVFLTTLVNGTTAGLLYKWLRVYPANTYKHILQQYALKETDRLMRAETYDALQAHLAFCFADWAKVQGLVPEFDRLEVRHGKVRPADSAAEAGGVSLAPIRDGVDDAAEPCADAGANNNDANHARVAVLQKWKHILTISIEQEQFQTKEGHTRLRTSNGADKVRALFMKSFDQQKEKEKEKEKRTSRKRLSHFAASFYLIAQPIAYYASPDWTTKKFATYNMVFTAVKSGAEQLYKNRFLNRTSLMLLKDAADCALDSLDAIVAGNAHATTHETTPAENVMPPLTLLWEGLKEDITGTKPWSSNLSWTVLLPDSCKDHIAHAMKRLGLDKPWVWLEIQLQVLTGFVTIFEHHYTGFDLEKCPIIEFVKADMETAIAGASTMLAHMHEKNALGVAAVQTGAAARAALRNAENLLADLSSQGFLDHSELDRLIEFLEEKAHEVETYMAEEVLSSAGRNPFIGFSRKPSGVPMRSSTNPMFNRNRENDLDTQTQVATKTENSGAVI